MGYEPAETAFLTRTHFQQLSDFGLGQVVASGNRAAAQSVISSQRDSRCHRGKTLRPDQRIVTRLPLKELWDGTGALSGERIRSLDQSSVGELVRGGTVRFIVADCGLKLEWIPAQRQFEFWKTVRPQVADPAKPIRLEEFPGATAYVASEWRGRDGECLVVLERYH